VVAGGITSSAQLEPWGRRINFDLTSISLARARRRSCLFLFLADRMIGQRARVSGFWRGACGIQAHDLGKKLVMLLQTAQLFEADRSCLIEVFRVFWRNILGVRSFKPGQGVDVVLENTSSLRVWFRRSCWPL